MHTLSSAHRSLACAIGLAVAWAFALVPTASAQEVVRPIVFPVDGVNSFRNDFHEPRGGGKRLHLGNDIIAAKMTPLVSVVDGYVNYVAIPQESWGYEVSLQDDEGYTYTYLHINNDTPGTDDGLGGVANAYPPGINRGARVAKGQLIGWVGDSGNAEATMPHLHFEMRDPAHNVLNPYYSLIAAAGPRSSTTTTIKIDVDEDPTRYQTIDLRYIFTKEMSEGVTSSEARQLQLTLRSFGHFKYPSITGYFGPVTRDALIAYQKKKNLPQTGRMDAKTRFAMNGDLGTYDPNVYIPFYSKQEQTAIEIAKLRDQIAKLQAQLAAMQPQR